MPDRGSLEQTLNERGVAFDYYADDATLEALVASSSNQAYDPAPPAIDRAALEGYLQGRGLAYDESLSDAELEAHVLALRDADHERYLERYQPVVTRLPGAVGTSPELPSPDDAQVEAAPAAVESPQSEPPDASGAGEAPSAVVEAAPDAGPGQAQPELGATGEEPA